MGEFLAGRGLTVRCPLLPGHGTSVADLTDLTRIRWQQWAEVVEEALEELQGRSASVVVGGLSLGALLTLWLGARHPDIAGLIVMAPAVRVRNRLAPLSLGLRYVVRYVPGTMSGGPDLQDPAAAARAWHYDPIPVWGAAELYRFQRQVVKVLGRIGQPILIFQGRHDHQVPPEAAQIVYDKVASTDKTLVWMEHSGHNLLVDGEREIVWARCYEWMLRVIRRS